MRTASLARTTRRLLAALPLLGVAGLAACGKDSPTAPTPVATTVTAAGGDAQTVTANAAATAPLAVKVLDANGNPITGAIVTWALTAGGGTISATSSTTDASGIAIVMYTAGLTSGTATITATVSSLTPVTFTETINTPVSPTTLVDYSQTGGNVATSFQAYTATAADASPVSVRGGGTLTLTAPVVTKTAGAASNPAASEAVGVNAGVLVAGISRVNILGGSVTTSAVGSTGLFATGIGSVLAMTTGTVATSGNASRGVTATFGGADSLTDAAVTTTGDTDAAGVAAGDSGAVVITRGSVTTAGAGSPAIFSTGAVVTTDAALTANGGAGAVVDGAGTVTLVNSTLTAKQHGVELLGTGAVVVDGGTVVSGSDAFFVRGSVGTITLRGAVATRPANGVLLDAQANGTATMTADGVLITGDLVADATSSATATLSHSALFRGALRHAALAMDSTTMWSVTGNSAATALTGAKVVTVDSTGAAPQTITNIVGNGFTVTYDASLPANAILAGKSYTLLNGGVLKPQ